MARQKRFDAQYVKNEGTKSTWHSVAGSAIIRLNLSTTKI